MKRLSILIAALLIAAACTSEPGWTPEEIALVNDSPEVMRVLVVTDDADSLLLHTPCSEFSEAMLRSHEYQELARKMVATVTSPEQDGVGIAGPQVGLSRRVVAVQRFDKDGYPFEVYPNIRVSAVRGDKAYGPEGCLSVPGRRGQVLRWQDIDITYTSPHTLRDTVESVRGFTSVIFQHECDHLDGILYVDYEDSVIK